MRIIFTKKEMIISKDVSFGKFGEVTSHIEYKYTTDFPMKFSGTPLLISGIDVTFEEGKIVEIILDVTDNTELTEKETQSNIPHMKLIGIATSVRYKRRIEVYLGTDNYYYLGSAKGTHTLRKTISRADYEKIESWLNKKELPQQLCKIVKQAMDEKTPFTYHVWDFTMIATAYKSIRLSWDGKRIQIDKVTEVPK